MFTKPAGRLSAVPYLLFRGSVSARSTESFDRRVSQTHSMKIYPHRGVASTHFRVCRRGMFARSAREPRGPESGRDR